ncbi:SDR family NAD(P)-dependent oxidoreductase [Dongia rigui]|uniref:SDR family NAD(P)-dependent oxidoreductase n=1 Tax=Dongia rigui TaxID=940149 RepID=A0ABU5DVM1_9PROT|nr:SDR family NAD(P)-dependent oxidoreductase [Dongia rigui]MDY0870753.1 SDR family NAD(P)-dependent oxidoreductase [Dongia rigui]
MNSEFKSILITGASSGLGAALAHRYARPGVHLHLGARRADLLSTVAEGCRAKGAAVAVESIDVTARDRMAEWTHRAHRTQPLDLVIANAGISGGTHDGVESDDQVRAIFSVNLDGVLNTILPVIPLLTAQRRGQIGIMGSLAGHRGFPGAPAYCGSKAAVKVWGEGLRGDLKPHHVGVSVILPGFVETPMTDVNNFKMPFLMSVEKAAGIIEEGLARNKARIAFPWPTAFVAWLLGTLPPAWTDPLLRAAPRKG